MNRLHCKCIRFSFCLWCMGIVIVIMVLPISVAYPAGNNPPYPWSDYITNIDFGWNTHEEHAYTKAGEAWPNTTGSDQWPMTWGSDGNVYGAFGDGRGFNEDGLTPRYVMGVTRMVGDLPGITGEEVWGVEDDGEGGLPNWKPIALVSFDIIGTPYIYMFANNEEENNWDNSTLFRSTDNGDTWVKLNNFFDVRTDGVQVKGICQFGQGNAGADGYVYVYLSVHYGTDIYLARVLGKNIEDRSQYSYYDGTGWTNNFADKTPVFHDDNAALIWHVGVSYNSGINRYLLATPHFAEGDDQVGKAWQDVTALGIFESEYPWGPWKTVYYGDEFAKGLLPGNAAYNNPEKDIYRPDDAGTDYAKFTYYIPTKYISNNGKTFWLAWSGHPAWDSISFVEASIGTLHVEAEDMTLGGDYIVETNAAASGGKLIRIPWLGVSGAADSTPKLLKENQETIQFIQNESKQFGGRKSVW